MDGSLQILPVFRKWLLAVLERMLEVGDTTPSWCVMRKCGLEPLQCNWFRAAMRLYNSLTKSNSCTIKIKGLTYCWRTAEYTLQWLLVSTPYSSCHAWSDTIVYLQTEAAKLWTHWFQQFCCTPQGETLGVLDTLFWNASERTQQQTPPYFLLSLPACLPCSHFLSTFRVYRIYR